MRTGVKTSVDVKKVIKEGKDSQFDTIMSVEDKLAVLEEIGRTDLVGLFKDWQPRQAKARKKSAPLDQRVSITVTVQEKLTLQKEMETTNKAGSKVTVSQFIRNRAVSTVDINGWRLIAEEALKELNEIEEGKSELQKQAKMITGLIDEEDDEEEMGLLERKLHGVQVKLKKIVAQNEKRSFRLTGRMSMAEAEVVKWRASRLCISTSDYLRFLIFDLLPDSSADGHMSLDAKRRFYVSIIDVAMNGWGEPANIAHCTQCSNYLETINDLQEELRLYKDYLGD